MTESVDTRISTDYQRSLVVGAPPAVVVAALSTISGLLGWWTDDVTGSLDEGGDFDVVFGDVMRKTMHVDAVSGTDVTWTCTACLHPEWVGTTLHYALADRGDGTSDLTFTHRGLHRGLRCYSECAPAWDYYLESLAAYVTSGRGTPFAA